VAGLAAWGDLVVFTALFAKLGLSARREIVVSNPGGRSIFSSRHVKP